MMDRKEAQAIVDTAIARLVERQPDLLALEVTERALSHHLAGYIAELVPGDLDVDVEYNRHGAETKLLRLPPRKAMDREVRATTVFPDILVHRRNTDKDNVLVLELKKPGEDLRYDELKLRAFRKELGYPHTAHVILGLDAKGDLVRDVIWVDG